MAAAALGCDAAGDAERDAFGGFLDAEAELRRLAEAGEAFDEQRREERRAKEATLQRIREHKRRQQIGI